MNISKTLASAAVAGLMVFAADAQPEKKVVWVFQDHKTMRTVSSVQVLDVRGNPLKRQVQH